MRIGPGVFLVVTTLAVTAFVVATLVLVALAPAPALAQSDAIAPPTSLEVEAQLRQARTHMLDLEYEQAIALLEPVLEATRGDLDRLEETYLLLIEAHVYRGNLSPPRSKERQLWYDEAGSFIREYLGVPELRRTTPDPPESYPAEMVELFDEIRREMFGIFEISSLDPPDAEVTFAGESLERGPNGLLRRTHVPIGTHVLLIRHDGYREVMEDIEIAPATVTLRSYKLPRDRGLGWYATRILAPVAAVTTIAILATRPAEEKPLPGPPDPPVLR